MPIINTLISTIQRRDERISEQESRLAELTKQLARSEARINGLLRKRDEEYIEKIKLWGVLCEAEGGLRKLDREVGKRLQAGRKRKALDAHYSMDRDLFGGN